MAKRRNNNNESPAATKKHRANDDVQEREELSDEDVEMDDADGIAASAMHNITNSDTRSGKILSIKLKNFMCHRNLTVDLNRSTNLIIGKNGSGKSAVLTALIIGLGCKANTTDRSSSIKQLIRRGENSSTIEIHISNDGSDGYEHEQYGDKITVVRHITASGGSTYKLKSQTGHVISTSRCDLLKMILYMNIQVDNPVCVLTQDASRSFLRDSNPKKRYQLFQKATQMDVILEKLGACTQQMQKSREQLEFQKKTAAQLKKCLDAAEEKHLQFQSIERLKVEIKNLKSEQHWIGVMDQEKFRGEVQKTLDISTAAKEQIVSDMVNSESNEQKLKDKYDENKLALEAQAQATANYEAKFQEKRKHFLAKNEIYQEKARELKRLESKRNRIQSDIAKMNEHIEERALAASQTEISKLRAKNEANLVQYKERRTELDALRAGAIRDIEMFTNTRAHQKEKMDDHIKVRQGILKVIDRFAQQEKMINKDPRQTLRLYGDYMPQMLADIEKLHKQGKFSEMPLGPIGSFVEVTNPKYLRYVEDILGPMAVGFLVNNARDRAVLSELFKRSYAQAANLPIVTSRFLNQPYNFKEKSVQPDGNSVSVIDLVKVSDSNILNCLIDQCKIETILITDSQDYAIRTTSRKENVPQNLFKVIVTEPYTEFYPAPLYRTYSKRTVVQKYLQPNMANREKYIQTELVKQNQEKARCEAEIQQLQGQIQETEKHLKDRRGRLTQLDPEIQNLRMNINELENYDYPAEDETDHMKNEIEVQTKNLTDLEAQIEVEMAVCAQLKANSKKIEEEINVSKRENQEYTVSLQEKKNEMDILNQQIHSCSTNKRHGETKLQKIEETIIKLNKEFSDADEKLLRLTRTAEKFGERVERMHNTVEEIITRIKNNERKINHINASGESLADVEHKLTKARNDFEENKQLVTTLESTIKMLHNSTKHRFTTTKKLMHFITSQVSYQFTEIMRLRGFQGDLLFDEANKTLEVSVVPRDKNVANAKSKTNSLSGGERSYSTVALLMSLWTCVDNPFYFLDEYDVFTDQVNRMYLTTLLLNEAKRKPHQQYAFLTPQDTSDIKPSACLSMLRMDDPERA